MTKNKTLAIVVTFNRLSFLKGCINALLKQSRDDFDILVIDNASTDGTDKYLSAIEEERIICRHLKENTGGAGGFNYGIHEASELGYSHVWIMDDDTWPEEDAYSELIAAGEALNGEYGYLSSVVLWKDGTECKMNRQKIKKAFYDKVELLDRSLILIDQATFVSLLIPISVVKEVGLPIKEYFIWGDDIEYTRRISVRKNIPSYLVGKSKVIHMMASNEGSNISTDDADRISRYRFAYRNDNRTYRFEGFKGWVYFSSKCGLNLFRILFRAKDHRFKRIRTLIGAAIKGYFFNPKIEYLK